MTSLDRMLADGLSGPEAAVIIAAMVLLGWFLWLIFRS